MIMWACLCAKPSEIPVPTAPAHEIIRVGQIEVQFRLDASQTGGAFTMFEFRVPVGARVPVPHSHESFEETVFGLDGVTTWMVSGESVTVGPGDVLFIPRGAVHGFDNHGTALARGLSVITPGLLGPQSNYRRDCSSAVSADLVDPAPGSPLRGTRPSCQQKIEATTHRENDPRTPQTRLLGQPSNFSNG